MAIDLQDAADVAAIKVMVDEAVNSLATKNKELLGELKEARKGATISPETVDKLEAQIDSLKAEVGTAQSAAKAHLKQYEQANKLLESETGFTQKLLVDNGLGDALIKAGVSNPALLKAVKSMLSSQVQVVTDGDIRVAKVGDKPLVEWIADWSKTDEAKSFITATQNNGGGATGGSNQSIGKTMTRTQFDAQSPASKMEFSKGGGTVTE